MKKTSYVDIVVAERKKHTPKTGFNVCTFDDFGRPGEMLTLIAHTDTMDEAKEIEETLEGEIVYIYGNTDETD